MSRGTRSSLLRPIFSLGKPARIFFNAGGITRFVNRKSEGLIRTQYVAKDDKAILHVSVLDTNFARFLTRFTSGKSILSGLWHSFKKNHPEP